MARRQGGTLSGFTPLSTPNAPTGLSVSAGIGSATVSFTAPTDTGDGAITSYIVTAVNESTGVSSGVTGTESPITISPGGGTFKIRAQAVNGFGPGRLSDFDTGNVVYSGQALYAWGVNNLGQLGDGTTVNKSSPAQVGALINWSQIHAGPSHTAATKLDGTLWTWGRNNVGQLGDNTTIGTSSPVQVGALTNWYQAALGFTHTIALKTDGTMWSWGSNGSGELAQNNAINLSSPVQVGALNTWAQVAPSAAIKTDGTLWGWGFNDWGSVGDNTTIRRSSPVQVGVLTNWSQVDIAGGSFAAAVKTDNTLWTWGSNNYGQLGDGTSGFAASRSSPVQIGALANWAKVAVGSRHAAAIKTDGTLWTWGYGNLGNLGDGTVISKSSPVQIGALTNWSHVSVSFFGGDHSVALKTDGTLWTWGRNQNGQLGDNTTIGTSSPVQIGASTDWTQAVCGGANTHALELIL